MGRTVRLDCEQAQVMVTETPQEHWDLGIFEHIGIDPTKHRFILLKSRMYCRPVFVPISKAVVECDGGGVTSSDYSRFRLNVSHVRYTLWIMGLYTPLNSNNVLLFVLAD